MGVHALCGASRSSGEALARDPGLPPRFSLREAAWCGLTAPSEQAAPLSASPGASDLEAQELENPLGLAVIMSHCPPPPASGAPLVLSGAEQESQG